MRGVLAAGLEQGQARERLSSVPPLAEAWPQFPTASQARQIPFRDAEQRLPHLPGAPQLPNQLGSPGSGCHVLPSRCQSVLRWPMGDRAGGQVISGQLAPHWCALPSLPLGLCARSE